MVKWGELCAREMGREDTVEREGWEGKKCDGREEVEETYEWENDVGRIGREIFV